MAKLNDKKFLNSNLCIKDVLDKTTSELMEIPSKKIILNGGRGKGKSLVLANCENLGIKNSEPFFATNFDPIGFAPKTCDRFNDKFMEHYYELVLSNKLLFFIESYYPLLFQEHFEDLNNKVTLLLKSTDKYINDSLYTDIELDFYLNKGDISEQIINDFKYYSQFDTFNLGIDRFDMTNASNSETQKLLSGYFELFDKVILVVDDESLNDEKRKNNLLNNDFAFMQIEYCKNFEIVKEILKKRIEYFNFEMNPGDYVFPFELITDDILNRLINETDGNITMMINIIYKVIKMWKWDVNNFNIDKEFKLTTLQEQSTNLTLKRFMKGPKFHL